jgi:hypothetical protein
MLFAISALLALPASAPAGQAGVKERAAAFSRVVQCRDIAETAERLACYDREVAALDEAEKKQQVVIVDREKVREAKRSLFGLKLPSIDLFGGNDENDPATAEIDQIEGTVASIWRQGDGTVAFRLPDGALWVQIDNKTVAGRLKPGSPVVIERGALGTYFVKLDGRPAFKAARRN